MKSIIFLVLTILTSGIYASSNVKQTETLNEKWLLKKVSRTFEPLKTKTNFTKEEKLQINLGKKLFFETKLSSNNKMSCNTCHNLKTFGVDNEKTSLGVLGKRGGRNSPTVLNAFLHSSQFWDGREPDVEAQALGPILNPVEMNMPSSKAVMVKLKADGRYASLFKNAFPKAKSPMTYKNLGKAIGAFERTLSTPTKFDSYLLGKKNALTIEEKLGLQTFLKVGCATCHNGIALGGQELRKLGEVVPYKTLDKGRFEVTKLKADLYFFKVPSLRNIEMTGPYFHDGSVKTLDSAIELMALHQLGQKITRTQVLQIKLFLKTLTKK